jgi:hypothetical protein
MAAMRRKREARYGAVLVIGLVLLVGLVGPITMSTAAAQSQTQSQRHKLVIIHVSGSPSWSITASGSIQLDTKTTENTDSIGGKTADGSVGGLPWEANTSDPRDVIYYTGEVLQFDLGGTGTARVKLDGKRVNPKSLKNTPISTPTPRPTIFPQSTVHATTTPTPSSPITTVSSPTPTMSPTVAPSPTPDRASPVSLSPTNQSSSSVLVDGALGVVIGVGILLVVALVGRLYW